MAYNVTPQEPTGGYTYNKEGWLEGFSSAQWAALESAVQGSATCVTTGCTAGTIDSGAISRLEASGLFTNDELDSIDYGLSRADPHGVGFYEHGPSEDPFVAQWTDQAKLAVTRWLSKAKPKKIPLPGKGKNHQPGSFGPRKDRYQRDKRQGGYGGGGGDSWIERLLPGLIRAGNQSSQTSGVPYQAPGTIGGGSSPLLLVGLLGGAGVLAYFVFRKKPERKEEHH